MALAHSVSAVKDVPRLGQPRDRTDDARGSGMN